MARLKDWPAGKVAWIREMEWQDWRKNPKFVPAERLKEGKDWRLTQPKRKLTKLVAAAVLSNGTY